MKERKGIVKAANLYKLLYTIPPSKVTYTKLIYELHASKRPPPYTEPVHAEG
jgi:hypothetical protein